ncbi:hypothetical protein ACIOKD_18765 [Streptomyces sp. NPDC087844]|uniref:hypothetical protein n=1 Tax=Streptomyces sp. NPDC087844 TaxID=3365805 RepID=UPI00381B47C1
MSTLIRHVQHNAPAPVPAPDVPDTRYPVANLLEATLLQERSGQAVLLPYLDHLDHLDGGSSTSLITRAAAGPRAGGSGNGGTGTDMAAARALEVGTVEAGTVGVGTPEVGAVEVGAVEARTVEAGVAQTRTTSDRHPRAAAAERVR